MHIDYQLTQMLSIIISVSHSYDTHKSESHHDDDDDDGQQMEPITIG